MPEVYYGFAFVGKKGTEKIFSVTCPCGVVATLPVNGIPLVDTSHPCGNPNHWTVKYFEKEDGDEAEEADRRSEESQDNCRCR